MQCNIDAEGRAVRRNGGIVCLVLALLSSGAAASGAPRRAFLGLGVFLGLMGIFQLYEARKGWCVARAMGFKTRI